MTTKETKELLIALIHLVKLLSEHLKDGVGVEDAMIIYDLVNDPVYKEALIGINQILPEIKNLSISDAIELIKVVLDELK